MKGQQENPASFKTFIPTSFSTELVYSTHLGIFPPKNAGFQAGTPGLPATRARIVFAFFFYIFRRKFSFYLTALFYLSTNWQKLLFIAQQKVSLALTKAVPARQT